MFLKLILRERNSFKDCWEPYKQRLPKLKSSYSSTELASFSFAFYVYDDV